MVFRTKENLKAVSIWSLVRVRNPRWEKVLVFTPEIEGDSPWVAITHYFPSRIQVHTAPFTKHNWWQTQHLLYNWASIINKVQGPGRLECVLLYDPSNKYFPPENWAIHAYDSEVAFDTHIYSHKI